MRWREILVTGIVTLLVTVVAGLVVWLLTREGGPVAEDLTYTVDVVTLSPFKPPLAVGTIKVSNVGKRAAQQLRVVVEIPSGSEFREKAIQLSSGAAAVFRDVSSGNSLEVDVPTLAPDEILTVTALVAGISKFKPIVSVKSSNSIGRPADPIKPEPSIGFVRSGFIALIFGALALQGFLLLFLRMRARRQQFWEENSVNNVAFLYLHQKLTSEAERMLSDYIRLNGGNSYYLSNHALALGIMGGSTESEARFNSAQWLADRAGGHARAVVSFNRASLCFARGDLEKGKEYLADAIGKSRKEILRYCAMSAYINDAAAIDPAIRDLVQPPNAKAKVAV